MESVEPADITRPTKIMVMTVKSMMALPWRAVSSPSFMAWYAWTMLACCCLSVIRSSTWLCQHVAYSGSTTTLLPTRRTHVLGRTLSAPL